MTNLLLRILVPSIEVMSSFVTTHSHLIKGEREREREREMGNGKH